MQNAVLVATIDESTRIPEGSGLLVFGIELRIGTTSFPMRAWTDIALPVLTAWCISSARLLRGASMHATVAFMDGPHEVDLEATEKDGLRLVCIDRYEAGRRMTTTGEASLDAFCDTVLDAAAHVAAWCRTKHYEARDVRALVASADDLRRAYDARFGASRSPGRPA